MSPSHRPNGIEKTHVSKTKSQEKASYRPPGGCAYIELTYK